MKKFNNKNIAILGYGLTGQEVLQYIVQFDYNNIYIIDDKIDKAPEYCRCFILSEIDNLNLDIIIKSPGIKYDHPLLLKYTTVEVTNDIEIAYEVLLGTKTKIIGITGTNGKTTFTMLLNHCYKALGFKSFTCGNIGVSPLTIISKNKDIDYLCLELSSFQLKQITNFKPYTGVLLNIKPDHLDYHKTFLDYKTSKLNMFKNGTQSNWAFIDEPSTYSGKGLNLIYAQEKIDKENDILNKYLNPCAASLLIAILKLDNLELTNIKTNVLKEFKLPPHRLEYVDTIDGVVFINDSKATNFDATRYALSRFPSIILLLGGYDKGEKFNYVKSDFNNTKAVLAYGSNKEKFTNIKNIEYFINLEEAYTYAVKIAKKDDVVLLSPASASFDAFENYEERGNFFKKLVKEQR